MKRLTAFICSVMILASIGLSFSVDAAYTTDELKGDILSAIDWTNTLAKPTNNIGSEGADLTVIAMSRAGISYDYNAYLSGLEKKAREFTQATDVSQIQRTALAVLACGGDGEYIADKDLVSLSSYYRSDEIPLGANGVNDFSGALITLNSKDFKTPSGWSKNDRDNLIRSILSYQENDGSFGSVEQTALAIIALAPYNNNVEYVISDNGTSKSLSCGNAIWNAVNYLSDVQSGDGEFYSLKDTALVSMAMDTIGIGTDDERMIKNGNSVIDGLLTYRNSDGGFSEDYNLSDKTATGYALCALVSRLRTENKLGSFFNFNKGGDLGLNQTQTTVTAKPGTSTTTRATSTARSTARATATAKPRTTLRPATTPRVRTTPSTSPSTSPTPTPRPTQRPDLVGPAVPIGPQIPATPDPMMPDTEDGGVKPAPVVAAVLAILALLGICCIYMMKKKIGIFKEQPKNEIYKAKQHRRTEEHRRFEQRMKINERGKYKGSRRR
ncbi:MAG: terpene cyclase/mutase family protein [Clostridia bacterium]|nr:terpene cyclase/mutase family protein [Clostridia bacterium]